MGEATHAGGVERVGAQHVANPVDNRLVGAFRGRRQLVQDGAVLTVDRHHQVRERTADVDPDVDCAGHSPLAVRIPSDSPP